MNLGAETTHSPEPDAKRESRLKMARAARARAPQTPSTEAREACQRLAEGWEFLARNHGVDVLVSQFEDVTNFEAATFVPLLPDTKVPEDHVEKLIEVHPSRNASDSP